MVHPDRFAGKVVVVTGAAQGLGEAVATSAAREGAAVACIDRSDLVHEVAGKLAAEGAQTIALTTDLERYLGASTAMAAARNRFGRIDVLINNVGGTIWAKPYAHYAEAEIEAEIRRSLFPTLWCCRARAADHGRAGPRRDRQRVLGGHPRRQPGALRARPRAG